MEKPDKLIAEFLGLVLEEGVYRNGCHLRPELREMLDYTRDENDLCFHFDWNWIMILVKNCKERQIFGSQHLIDEIDNALIAGDIGNLYQDCINFINFYNQNS